MATRSSTKSYVSLLLAVIVILLLSGGFLWWKFQLPAQLESAFSDGGAMGYKQGAQEGSQYGYQQAVIQIVEKTSDTENCEPINLFVEETKVDLINVLCVNK